MRVAFVSETFLPAINGVTNSVLRALEYLAAEGHEAMVIAPQHPDGVPKQYQGFPVYEMPSMTLPWYPSLRVSVLARRRIHKLFKEFKPDVVHLASPFLLGNDGVQVARRMKLPCVALYQTEMPAYIAKYSTRAAEPFAWQHIRIMHNQATLTLAPSSYTRDQLISQGVRNVRVWGRGIDTERFNPAKRDQALHDTWAPNGEVVVGYMGRLGAEKQVENLRVLADIEGIKGVIIGDGPERSYLERLLPQAEFVGMKTGEELARHLASLDVFVHTGELETFGQAIQEAQASGLPVVAPRKGGPIDLVKQGVDGYLYEPGNLGKLRSRVASLVADEQLRHQLGAAGRARTEGRSWQAICDELMGHYRDAIALNRR